VSSVAGLDAVADAVTAQIGEAAGRVDPARQVAGERAAEEAEARTGRAAEVRAVAVLDAVLHPVAAGRTGRAAENRRCAIRAAAPQPGRRVARRGDCVRGPAERAHRQDDQVEPLEGTRE